MSLGKNIKKIRLKQNLKQSELAEKSKVSRVAIGNYERGDRIPNAEVLQAIAEALNVTIYDLMYDVTKIEKEVINIKETEQLLILLGYEIEDVAPAASTEEEAAELNELIKNDKIPIYEVYSDNKLIAELTNSQFNNLKESIKSILDYELYKLNAK